MVAPRRGAWVETALWRYNISDIRVAPRRGAWVETDRESHRGYLQDVAPRRGAWVETTPTIDMTRAECRTPQGCVG